MTMHVLSVAFPFAPIRADTAGGAEQILLELDRALVEAGHESVVVAPTGSRVRGHLIPIAAVEGEWNDAARTRQHCRVREAIAAVLAHRPFDLVHCHGLDFDAYLPPPDVPVLATLHLPLARYPPAALRPTRPLTHLLAVSRAQYRNAPPDVPLLPPIANGVAANPFAGRVRKCDFALALARTCPENGLEDAVRATRAADIDLMIAGTLLPWPAHLAYFSHVLEPLLDARHRLVGAMVGPRKQKLLAAARCVLIPSRAPETSSLVAMEALAAGTPVIAYANGALANVIEDGVTGWLVHDVAGMAAAIERVDSIDPRACVRAARERCGLARMLDGYLALYARLIALPRGSLAGAAA
ncbi:MAG: glycosyltransferase [Rhodanobacteraceae bacterium]